MSASTITGGSPALLLALQQQESGLDALAARVDTARARLPAVDASVWRGPAHSLYTAAIGELSSQLLAVQTQVRTAARETRRALATVAQHD
jgi:hypothetical protein